MRCLCHALKNVCIKNAWFYFAINPVISLVGLAPELLPKSGAGAALFRVSYQRKIFVDTAC